MSAIKPKVDVCIFIDPLHDFLHENGVFCKTYGLLDTSRVRGMKAVLSELLSACIEKKSVHVVLVSSIYGPNQFENIKNLCVSPEGQDFALDGVSELLSGPQISVTVLRKTTNSILTCSDESYDHLLRIISGRNVLISGVTSTACVDCAVNDLAKYCNCILVARDSIACRNSAIAREQKVIESWQQPEGMLQDKHAGSGSRGGHLGLRVIIFDTWREIFET